jgi:hypothetical protein
MKSILDKIIKLSKEIQQKISITNDSISFFTRSKELSNHFTKTNLNIGKDIKHTSQIKYVHLTFRFKITQGDERYVW